MSGECEPCGEHCIDCNCNRTPTLSKCRGILGKIYGHDFKEYTLKSRVEIPIEYLQEIMDTEKFIAFIDSYRGVYCIRCKRCGVEA